MLLMGSNRAFASIVRATFSPEYSAWSATDIVVVSEAATVDGNVGVLETWKGPLKPGDKLFVPELAEFAPQAKRAVYEGLAGNNQQPVTYVTGEKLVLFLRKPQPAPATQKTTSFPDEAVVSFVWMEHNRIYGTVRDWNSDPGFLAALQLSESQMKARVSEVLRTQTALNAAVAVKNLAQRARALRPFLQSTNLGAQQLAFGEMSRCGEAALPVLRPMLRDETLLPLHGYIVDAMGVIGGASVEAQLIAMVGAETKFWKQTAPQLKIGWWGATGLSWSQATALRDRYMKLFSAIRALEPMRADKSRGAVVQLRDFWRSLPQLEDKSGLDQMSETCDELLEKLALPR